MDLRNQIQFFTTAGYLVIGSKALTTIFPMRMTEMTANLSDEDDTGRWSMRWRIRSRWLMKTTSELFLDHFFLLQIPLYRRISVRVLHSSSVDVLDWNKLSLRKRSHSRQFNYFLFLRISHEESYIAASCLNLISARDQNSAFYTELWRLMHFESFNALVYWFTCRCYERSDLSWWLYYHR